MKDMRYLNGIAAEVSRVPENELLSSSDPAENRTCLKPDFAGSSRITLGWLVV